ncbi:YolD-like family protein [Brevibacillus centrosporus]|uniref:YolD-like family protein n=1 Tax=Brevibacillus centrosporus TaxID=54910 RepID=UPI003B025319
MASKIDNLFGSMRWVLPEQKEAILGHNAERGLIERPFVNEEEFGEMCFRIYDSTQYDYAIFVKYFLPQKGQLGRLEKVWGVVREINPEKKQFKIVSDWESQWINVEDLVSVTK